MDYRLEAVWPAPSDEVRAKVVEFWLAERALPNRPAAVRRAPQLSVVAFDPDGGIAGVSTIMPRPVDQLGFPCFFYRTFVGRAHRAAGLRKTGLYQQIAVETYRHLNERFQQGHDPELLGLYYEVENPKLRRVRNEAIWQGLGANIVFIGITPRGQHARIWYFENARLPHRD